MALESCPSCRRFISSAAVSCPKCGHPLGVNWVEEKRARAREKNRRTWRFIGRAVVLAITVPPSMLIGMSLLFSTLRGSPDTAVVEESMVPAPQQVAAISGDEGVTEPATLLIRSSPKACKVRKQEGWSDQCSWMIGTTDVRWNSEESSTKVAIAYDGIQVRVWAMIPITPDEMAITSDESVLAVIDGINYVPTSNFFDSKNSPDISVGGSTFPLEWNGEPHWATSIAYTRKLIGLFSAHETATISYTHVARGRGQSAKVPLAGFAKILADFDTRGDPISVVNFHAEREWVQKAEKDPGKKCGYDGEAFTMVQLYVTQRLKNPSGADFSLANAKMQMLECGRWRVSSYVDATNSYGATIRTPFSAIARKRGEDDWVIEQLDMR